MNSSDISSHNSLSNVKNHLGWLLLRQVLSIYFALTIVVTLFQIFIEFSSTKSLIGEELKMSFESIKSPLALALWGLEDGQIQSIGQGISSLPIVGYFAVWDELQDSPLAEYGHLKNLDTLQTHPNEFGFFEQGSSFGIYLPLIFLHGSEEKQVGRALLISSKEHVISRLKIGIIMLIINAILKSLLLMLLFLMVFRKHLVSPLEWLITRIKATHFEYLSGISKEENPEIFSAGTELSVLLYTYNDLISRLRTAHDIIQNQNQSLAREVDEKTKHLTETLKSLATQKADIEQSNLLLSNEISIRRQAQTELITINETLERSLKQLHDTQKDLIVAEKMASLGNLVAGVAHEINTPVGTSLTAVSHLKDIIDPINESFKKNTLTKTQLSNFIESCYESVKIMEKCLNQAAYLIKSFKMVAVDQGSEDIRKINLNEYIGDVILSLKPHLKRLPHKVELQCSKNIELICKPGMISQLITNLIMNSIIHAFDENFVGVMAIDIQEDVDNIYMHYHDNGKGISEEHLKKLFEPFFTTKRGQGGSGLGTHIIFNIVTQSFNGTINATSRLGEGLNYDIVIPKHNEKINKSESST